MKAVHKSRELSGRSRAASTARVRCVCRRVAWVGRKERRHCAALDAETGVAQHGTRKDDAGDTGGHNIVRAVQHAEPCAGVRACNAGRAGGRKRGGVDLEPRGGIETVPWPRTTSAQ